MKEMTLVLWRYNPARRTVLQTARSAEFATEEGVNRGISMAGVFGIDALVVIGGDGSFRGARTWPGRG